jgi:hypothetical protein
MARPKKQTFMAGVVEDPRPDAEKQRDYRHEELATAAPFNWTEVPEAQWRQYPIFNQDGSGSCVAQATAKALGIERKLKSGQFVQYSARDIYTRRNTKPTPGMYLVDALNIVYKNGCTVEQLMASQLLGEQAMNDDSDRNDFDVLVALNSKESQFVTVTPDIDTIASIIEPTGKPVVITVRFSMDEWNQQVPTLNPAEQPTLGHGICCVQATLWQGKKALIIDDSWGTGYGIGGKRVITQDWFTAGRITAAGYFTTFQTQNAPSKPIYQFNSTLAYGLTVNADVKALQSCLNFLGMFPDAQSFTGNYYGITMAAVKLYQTSKGIPATGQVDAATLHALNQDFAQ